MTQRETAIDILKAISNLSQNKEINVKVIELQGVILSLQSQLLQIQKDFGELIDEKEQLKKQLAEVEDWGEVEKEYKLSQVAPGVYVYASAPDAQSSIPAHWLCSNCVNKKQKSILQLDSAGDYGRFYKCPNCGYEIAIRERNF